MVVKRRGGLVVAPEPPELPLSKGDAIFLERGIARRHEKLFWKSDSLLRYISLRRIFESRLFALAAPRQKCPDAAKLFLTQGWFVAHRFTMVSSNLVSLRVQFESM